MASVSVSPAEAIGESRTALRVPSSTTPMLNTAITALQNAYAKATEKAVRDHLYAEIKAQRDASSDANKIDAPQLANMTIDDWILIAQNIKV